MRERLPSHADTTFSSSQAGGSYGQGDGSHSSASGTSRPGSVPDDDVDDDADLMPSAGQLFHRFLVGITPSFLQQWIEGSRSTTPQKLHEIAALDGLRGWACLMVFNFHFLFTYTHTTMTGWGFGGQNWGIQNLPIVHLLISGHVMVTIFFVISGYVLSYKPLKLVRSDSWEQAFHTLASSTFRRALRLYIPSLVGVLMVFVAVRMGAYDYSIAVRDDGHTIRGINEEHPQVFYTLTNQFWDAYKTVVYLMNPFKWDLYYNDYNPQLWTIPVEFRCSIVLFLTILLTSRLRPRWRLWLVSVLIWFCIRWGRWDVVLFLSGMFLAEVDLDCGLWDPKPSATVSHREPKGSEDSEDLEALEKGTTNGQATGALTRHHGSLWLGIFIVGLFISSSPNTGAAYTPGYRTLYQFTPETYPEPHRFLQSVGAIIVVAGVNHSTDLQHAFTNALAQYLGRISFAFYVVHGPILHCLGYSLMANIWAVTGKETNLQYCLGFLIGHVICLTVSIWAGDMFYRGVDIPSVRFTRWIESCLLVPSLT